MPARRETFTFALVLGAVLAGFFGECLFGGKVLSPADVLFASASFEEFGGPGYEPANRLLIDPVLQFQPWIERNRAMIRAGRMPLWNESAGCGAPLLANGQSAPFDPFQWLAYLTPLPRAYALMAFARLWTAGFGMFLLAGRWGLGRWGRWFAGLAFPFCGFLVLWLSFPVTNVAVWMPWIFWASDGLIERVTPRRFGALALVTGFVVLGGHIQTSAHVLLAVGGYVAWRALTRQAGNFVAWAGGIGLGLAIGSVTILPLAVYLTKSPVWGDRKREAVSPWRVAKPRLLDAVCTAVPYVYGSQRRGHPNLARALGVHNLNESAGGFAGLATLIWLAPQAWKARRRQPRVVYLAALGTVGFLGSYGFPPVANVLRALPVLDVIDARRMCLWVAFALVLLGGVGLDQIEPRWPAGVTRWWVSLWIAAAAGLTLAACSVSLGEPWFRLRAERHYARATSDVGAAGRAERQVRATVKLLPVVLGLTAAQLATLAALVQGFRTGRLSPTAIRTALTVIPLAELFAFGYGVNPSIDPAADRPLPAVVRTILKEFGEGARVLGLGAELPPNVAMRYGLADPRNYDSVELTRSLDWFEPMYEPGAASRSSRRDVTWDGVVRSRELLYEAGVVAVVAATPPPGELIRTAERVGSVWLVRLAAAPLVSLGSSGESLKNAGDHGRVAVDVAIKTDDAVVVRQTFDEGWRAEVDGVRVPVEPYLGAFLTVKVPAGNHRLLLTYDPWEVRVACASSLGALAAAVFALSGFRPVRPTRFRPEGLGRSQAIELESNLTSLGGIPDRPITEG